MSSQDEPRIPSLNDTANHPNQTTENDINLKNHQQPQQQSNNNINNNNNTNFNNNLNGSFKLNLNNNNNNRILSNNNNNNKNGKLPHLSVINNGTGQSTVNGTNDDWKIFNGNGTSYNNNDEEYKLENKEPWSADTTTVLPSNNNIIVKLNGNNGLADKLAEEDPLTGHKHKKMAVEESDEDLVECGIGRFQPKWARSFASTNVFLVVFVIAWMFQGMYFTYFVSVITTIEKLFQIKSKTIGMLLSVSEVGQICTSLFLTYFAGRGHRPRWIACGMILFAISAFGSILPHFLFGDRLYKQILQQASSNSLATSQLLSNTTQLNINENLDLCLADAFKNATNTGDVCNEAEQVILGDHIQYVLMIFAVSLFGIGVGQTAIATLGIPYIDDNVSSRESPIYMAITIGVRILGPTFGFILGSFCTRIYVNLKPTTLETSDPKWIGAWWLGLLVVSCCMGLAAIFMFMFPKNFKNKKGTQNLQTPIKLLEPETNEKAKSEGKMVKLEEEQEELNSAPKFRDFPKTIKKHLKNDILMLRTASSVLHLLPVAGLYTFLPKYLETQFRVATHNSALISGIGGISVMGIGVAMSGIVILKVAPSARSVAAWIAFTSLVYSAGMALLSTIGCPSHDFRGIQTSMEQGYEINYFAPPCTLDCICEDEKFAPICGSDGKTYFSSCHAGCNSSSIANGKLNFENCLCIPPFNTSQTTGTAEDGYCGTECTNVYIFVSLFVFFVFIHSTSEVGSILLTMRCTHPKDKAMAMGIIQFAIGLFGQIPCPIIYGAVVDAACRIWGKVCGKTGYCSIYDSDMFRHYFLGVTSVISAFAFIMDIIVWCKAHRIDIDPENSTTKAKSVEDGKNVPPICNENEALNGDHLQKISRS